MIASTCSARALGRVLAVGIALAGLTASPASADWPMARHDAARTATGDGTSEIDTPAIAWRYYLGGTLGREQYVTFDVDDSGSPEVLFVMGGALLAKTPEDSVVWETDALDLTRIDGLVDLDGDGEVELVATARAGRVYVIRPTDGAVRWALPSGVIGNTGNVRFADFDGDDVLDLYVADNACGSTGSLGDIGIAYRFADDVTAPAMIFQLERGRRDYICGGNDTLVDIDGDGQLEVVAQGRFVFYVYSTVDGHLELQSDNIGSIPYGQARTIITDTDGDGRDELVCFTDNSYAPPVNSRRVFVMDFEPGDSPALVKRWEVSADDLLVDRHSWFPGGVADLLGDGSPEVVTSFYDGNADTWRTVILAAADGSELAVAPVGPFRGLANVDSGSALEILAEDGGAVAAYSFRPAGMERIARIPNTSVLFRRDMTRHQRQSVRALPVTLDVNRDGVAELVLLERTDAGSALVAMQASGDGMEVARLEVEEDVSLQTFEIFDSVTRDYPQLLVARSDGYLWVLDDAFRPTNARTSAEIPTRGLRIGGFYSGITGFGPVPVAADLDGVAGDEVVTRDSRGVVLRLDVGSASLIEPPAVPWQIPGGVLPTLVDVTGDGRPEVALGTSSDADAVRVFRATDASLLWERAVGSASRGFSYDLVVGDLSGDDVPDIAYELYETSGGTVVINALSGTDGSPLWAADYETVVAGSGLGASAIFDYEGDGDLDLLTTPRNTYTWLDGSNGTQLAQANGGYPNHGTFHDIDGDGEAEIIASGGVHGVRAQERDLTEIWHDGGGQHTRIQGAIAVCPDGPRYMQGYNNTARFTIWAAADGNVLADMALRGGERFSPPDSVPDGSGVLGGAIISPDLTGEGHPSVLVPSTDGHLYALNPCTGTLDWTLDFRFPVGQAILADTDGDGDDEILVTVADGFLYGVDREVLAAPAFVVENDGMGRANGPGEDIDAIVTTSQLWANWASVEGATAYEYAVITPGGAPLTEPAFTNVGDATEAHATGLPLVVGGRYHFAVRAIGPEGTSGEALSDGIEILPDPCDACAADERCVAGMCEPDPCFEVMCEAGEVCVEGTCMTGGMDAGPSMDGGMSMMDAGPMGESSGGCCTVAPGTSEGGRGLGGLAGLALVALVWVRRRRS